jgi:hypothetical protein
VLTDYRLDLRDRLLAEVPMAEEDLGIQPGFYPGISPDQFRHAVRWGTGPCPGQITDPGSPPGFIVPPQTRGLAQAMSRHGTSSVCPLPIFVPDRVTEYHDMDCDVRAQGYRILSPSLARELVLLCEITGKEELHTAECSCGGWYGGMLWRS